VKEYGAIRILDCEDCVGVYSTCFIVGKTGLDVVMNYFPGLFALIPTDITVNHTVNITLNKLA
jgi:hypothetical protein